MRESYTIQQKKDKLSLYYYDKYLKVIFTSFWKNAINRRRVIFNEIA